MKMSKENQWVAARWSYVVDKTQEGSARTFLVTAAPLSRHVRRIKEGAPEWVRQLEGKHIIV